MQTTPALIPPETLAQKIPLPGTQFRFAGVQTPVPQRIARMRGLSVVSRVRGGRGRGRGTRGASRFKPTRGGYKGAGIPLTPVEPGFKYYKASFMENPWLVLERQFASVSVNDEEIKIDLDLDEDMDVDDSDQKDSAVQKQGGAE